MCRCISVHKQRYSLYFNQVCKYAITKEFKIRKNVKFINKYLYRFRYLVNFKFKFDLETMKLTIIKTFNITLIYFN